LKNIIATHNAPAAIGPYSQGITYEGCLIFTAGQIGIDPSNGKMVDGGVEAQTEQALNNLREVLEAGRSTLSRILKVTIYLADMNDFTTVNEIYANFFPNEPPVRTAIQVAALPMGALIEIECIAASK